MCLGTIKPLGGEYVVRCTARGFWSVLLFEVIRSKTRRRKTKELHRDLINTVSFSQASTQGEERKKGGREGNESMHKITRHMLKEQMHDFVGVYSKLGLSTQGRGEGGRRKGGEREETRRGKTCAKPTKDTAKIQTKDSISAYSMLVVVRTIRGCGEICHWQFWLYLRHSKRVSASRSLLQQLSLA